MIVPFNTTGLVLLPICTRLPLVKVMPLSVAGLPVEILADAAAGRRERAAVDGDGSRAGVDPNDRTVECSNRSAGIGKYSRLKIERATVAGLHDAAVGGAGRIRSYHQAAIEYIGVDGTFVGQLERTVTQFANS